MPAELSAVDTDEEDSIRNLRARIARGFGEAGEGYLRLALVENEHRLRQAVRQIGRCLRIEKAASAS